MLAYPWRRTRDADYDAYLMGAVPMTSTLERASSVHAAIRLHDVSVEPTRDRTCD